MGIRVSEPTIVRILRDHGFSPRPGRKVCFDRVRAAAKDALALITRRSQVQILPLQPISLASSVLTDGASAFVHRVGNPKGAMPISSGFGDDYAPVAVGVPKSALR